jgi:hypothetical protein
MKVIINNVKCDYCQKETKRAPSKMKRYSRTFCSKQCYFDHKKLYPEEFKARKIHVFADGSDRSLKRFKDCKHCKTSYLPTSSRQKWCLKCAPHTKARRFLQRYDLCWNDYEKLISGKCALCENQAKVIDHDHVTGKLRNALCNGCNVGLSRFENVNWRKKAMKYLEG